jgi:hypothetical protein
MRGTTWLGTVLVSFMALGLVSGCVAPEDMDEPEVRTAGEMLVVSSASLANARRDHTVTVLANGKVLAVGGNGSSGQLASCELYDPATGQWTTTGSMSTARAAHAAVLLNDGTVLVAGGINSSSTLSSVERYNPATGTWSTMPPLANAIWDLTATRLQDGRVLVTGGCPSPSKTAAQLFDPVTNTWSTTGSMTIGRCDHTATLLNDGRVLITGGIYQAESQRHEIYDPATGVFTATPLSNTYKSPHEATRLADGRVLLLANWGTTGNEFYDPATNSWSTAPVPNDQRSFHAAVLMNDDSVLVFGGDPSSIERFAGGAWSIVGHTSGEREDPGVAVLQDGSVMLVGGTYTQWVQNGPGSWSGSPASLATTEIYRYTPSQLAQFDTSLRVPKCGTPQVECDSHSLLHGRGSVGAEVNQPNTINATCADGNSGSAYDETVRALRVRSSNGSIMQAGQQVTIQAAVTVPAGMGSTDMLDIFHAANANAPSWQLVASIPIPLSRSGLHDLTTTFTLPAGSLQAIRGSFRRGGTAVACSTGTYDDHDDLVFAVSSSSGPDSTPPSVAFTSPTAGALHNGTVTITATASDNVGVARVEFFHGSTLVFTDAAAPYTVMWGAPNGPVTLTARAYDAAGNVGTASVSFTADRIQPAVSITAPASGATVSGTVIVSASATDNTAVSRVSFYANGALIGTATAAPFQVSWNTAGLVGSQSLVAQAVDSVGNSANSATVTVSAGSGSGTNASYDPNLRTAACTSVGISCDSHSLFTGRGSTGPEQNAPNTLGATCADGTGGTFHSDESLDRLRVFTTNGTNLSAGSTVTIQATVWAYSGYTSDQLDLYYTSDARNPTWVLLTTLTPAASGANTLTASYTLPSGTLQAIRGQFRYGSGSGPCTVGSYNDRDDLVFAVAP